MPSVELTPVALMMVGGSPSPVLPGVSPPVEAKPLGLGLEREPPEPLAPEVLVALENDKEIVAAHSLDPGTGAGAGAAPSLELPMGLIGVIGRGAESEPATHLVTERGARVTRGRAVMG